MRLAIHELVAELVGDVMRVQATFKGTSCHTPEAQLAAHP